MLQKLKNAYSAQKFWEKFSLYICPMLLGCSICYAMVYEMYEELTVFYTVLFLFFEYILFSFFDRLKKRRILGGIIYTVILAVIVFLSIQMVSVGIRMAGNWSAARNWFYSLDTVDDGELMFFNALYLGGGFIIISILYYFTQVRYRTLGVMLSILFPFVIYARRSSTMPELLVTVIVSLYLAVVVHNRRLDPAQPKRAVTYLKIDRSYIISIAIFVSVSGAITMLVDKPTYTSELERNSGYFNYNRSLGTSGFNDNEMTTDYSDKRYRERNYSGEPLFYFDTDGQEEEYFLRRQSFYDFNGHVWAMKEHSGSFGDNDSEYYGYNYNDEYSTDDILRDMKLVLPFMDINGIDPEKCIKTENGRVYDENYSPIFLPAPLGTIVDEEGNTSFYRYNDEMYLRSSAVIADKKKLDEKFRFYAQSRELYKYAMGLQISDYSDLLFKAQDRIDKKLEEKYNGSDQYELSDQLLIIAADNLIYEYLLAQENYLGQGNISSRLSNLADDITKDCKSDIEKALALENYFSENGYIYDDEYMPSNDSIDYFVFESKTGVCTSYATAMTLMARSLQLPARYVEGFAAFEKTDSDTFVIRDQHAHAFVEIYIPGAGWLTFDPTVADYREVVAEQDGFKISSLFKKLSSLAVVLIVAVFVLFSFLRDRISELFFRIAQLFRAPQKATLKLYENLIKVLSFAAKEDMKPYTVNMIREHILSKNKQVPEKLLTLFERTAFGGYSPTKEEYRSAYSEYKKCYRYLRKHK